MSSACTPLNHNGLGSEFFNLMKKNSDKIAQYIVATNESDTYSALLIRSIRTSLHLKAKNLAKDDIICLCTYNHTNSSTPLIASLFLGIKITCLDPSLSVNDTAYLLGLVKPKLIFVVSEAVKLIEDALNQIELTSELVVFGKSSKHEQFSDYLTPPERQEDEITFRPEPISSNKDTAVILFSSGTTGFPKGICLSHYGIRFAGDFFTCFHQPVESAASLYYTTLYWISGILFLTSTMLTGTARVVCEKFELAKIWTIIDKYKVSFIFLPPSLAIDMCKLEKPTGIDTSSLLTLFTGGSTISKKQMKLFRKTLPSTFITQGYGQTETSGPITIFHINNPKDIVLQMNKPTSCGRLMPGLSARIVDPDTERVLDANQQGELRLKSEILMNGYYNMDSSDSFDAEGWLKTGDICYYDEDECFYMVDRIKEMIKYRSWHVLPAALEQVLLNHSAVKKAVVVGIPHEEDGDHPMGVVVLENSAGNAKVTAKDLEDYVAERVDNRKKLRAGVKFVDDLPVTPTGKYKRRLIRDMVLKGIIK